MNLTIHERFGGGFCVELTATTGPIDTDPDESGRGAYAEADTLTLTFGSIDAPPVTFTSFSDLARVLHGDLRLSIKETSC